MQNSKIMFEKSNYWENKLSRETLRESFQFQDRLQTKIRVKKMPSHKNGSLFRIFTGLFEDENNFLTDCVAIDFCI